MSKRVKKRILDVGVYGGKFRITLDIYENVTIVVGNSGTGKSYMINLISRLIAGGQLNNAVVINYKNKHMVDSIKSYRNKLIFIDNADILLSNGLKRYIAYDESNYYIIMGRETRYLEGSPFRVANIVANESGIQLDYFLADCFIDYDPFV